MENLEELEPKKQKKEWIPSAWRWKGGGVFAVTSILVLILLGSEIQKINSVTMSSWTEDQTADCGVVLTGGPSRIPEGFSLLAQKRIKKLIITGVNPKAKLNEIFPQRDFYGEMDEKDVILEKRSKTTYGNAQQSAVLIDALKCRDIILVTSQKHMYRAGRSFSAVLPESFPVYHRAISYGRIHTYSFEVFEEAVKSLFYSIWAY